MTHDSSPPALTDAEIAALNERFESCGPARNRAPGPSIRSATGSPSAPASAAPAGMAILHMVAQLKPNVHVFVLDTDYLFEETQETMRRSRGRARPPERERLQVEDHARGAGRRSTAPRSGCATRTLCCEIRKIEPNRRALDGKTCWVCGLRRDQSEGRADTPIVSWNNKFRLVKLNPLATWTEKQTWAYIIENKIPYNPLLDQGYASIGCYNCTVPGVQGRAGRWAGLRQGRVRPPHLAACRFSH